MCNLLMLIRNTQTEMIVKEHYDSRVGDGELYSLGADLQSLIQQQGWKLERRFGRSYFAFCYGRRRVFGVNIFRNPRLAIWGTEEDESKFLNLNLLILACIDSGFFPREATVKNLRDILESAYNDVQREK